MRIKGISIAVSIALGSVALALATSAPAAPSTVKPSRTTKPQLVDSAASLQRKAKQTWPESFAGLWIERGKILIAFTERSRNRVKKLRRRAPKPGKVRNATLGEVIFDDSLIQLEATLGQATADRAAKSLISAAYDLTIDIQRNTVVAIVEAPTDRTRQVFQLRYGDKVEVRQGHLNEPFACTKENCGTSMRGGLVSNVEPKPRGCTTGFVVRHRGPVKNLILSAGHCAAGDEEIDLGARRYTGSPFRDYGFVFLDTYGGPVDAEVHKVSAEFDSRKPIIYLKDSRRAAVVLSSGKIGNVVEGMEVCKSGKTTGYTCGEVLDTAYNPNGVLDHLITFSGCAWQGDSGGPVVREFKQRRSSLPGIQAEGLLQGGSKAPVGLDKVNRCDENGNFKPEWGADAFSTFSHIDYIDSALPVNVLRLRDLKKK